MGCDVHVYVEALGEGGRWEHRPPPTIALFKNRDGSDYEGEYWYWGRNYDLFALLADVRNGFGFAGVDTGDRIEPLDQPRGLPGDLSPGVAQEAADWEADGHSHTWFTLRELRAVDYDGRHKTHRGWVGPAGYRDYLAAGRPSSWSGGVSGPGVRHVSELEMRALVDGTGAGQDARDPLGGPFCQVQWRETLRQSVGAAWFEFLDRASALTLDDGSDVRAVLWFDN